MGGGAVAEPAVELGLVFELLAAGPGDDEEAGVDFGEGGHVAPEFFELGDGEDIFLAVAPAFFDVLEGEVGGHAAGEAADGIGDFEVGGGAGEEVGALEAEGGEELIEVDPGRKGIIVGEVEFIFFAGHGEAFDEAGAAVDAGEAAAAVFEAAGDDFEAEGGAAGEVLSEEGGVDVGAEGVDVVKEEGLELGAQAQKFR